MSCSASSRKSLEQAVKGNENDRPVERPEPYLTEPPAEAHQKITHRAPAMLEHAGCYHGR